MKMFLDLTNRNDEEKVLKYNTKIHRKSVGAGYDTSYIFFMNNNFLSE